MASIVSQSTTNSAFVKDSRRKSPQTVPDDFTAGIFRTNERNLASLQIVAKHGLPSCGCDRDGQGGVSFTFQDLHGEGLRLQQRWREARRRLRRAARAARQARLFPQEVC